MMKRIYAPVIAEELNEAYTEGYRFYVGELPCATTDPWGIPGYKYTFYRFFDTFENAKEFALFEKEVCKMGIPEVHTIPEHTQTNEEIRAELKEKKEEKKAKQLANQKKKAENLNLTLEEFQKQKKIKSKITRYKREVKGLLETIERLKEEIEYKQNFIKDNENKIIV